MSACCGCSVVDDDNDGTGRLRRRKQVLVIQIPFGLRYATGDVEAGGGLVGSEYNCQPPSAIVSALSRRQP